MRGRELASVKTEPCQVRGAINVDVVRSTLNRERDDLVTVGRLRDSRAGGVLLGRGWGLAQAEDVGPLLDHFPEVLVVEG